MPPPLHARLQVRPEHVAEFFAPLPPEHELQLPPHPPAAAHRGARYSRL